MSRYVIYDCDIGTDDAWGLLLLVKGEELHNKVATPSAPTSPTTTLVSCPWTTVAADPDATAAMHRSGTNKFKILGVTCVHGNTDVENGAKNAVRLLNAIDREDIPVYKGCKQPILPRTWERKRFFHGQNGFGDLEFDDDDMLNPSQIRINHAVNAMYNFACQYPKLVDFILVGPMTNFAMCINMYGSDFLDKVGNIYIMGGNHRAKGNITKSAEFNFMMDPEAAHIVLENVKTPIVLLPWETCIDGDFGLTLNWRFEVLGAVESKVIALLNRVEKEILIPKGFENWIVADAMMAAAYVFPHLAVARKRPYHATVELTGTHTRGQMVLDHLRHKTENVHVIMEIHREHWKNIISWAAGIGTVDMV